MLLKDSSVEEDNRLLSLNLKLDFTIGS